MENPLSHLWLFIASVFGHTFTLLAGCVVTVMISLIEKHLLNGKRLPLRWDIGILLTFVFFACFQSWRDKYAEAETAKFHLQQTTVPQLAGKLGPLITAPAGKDKKDTLLTIEAKVTNTGAPSIAQDFTVKVRLPNGQSVSGMFVQSPPEGEFFTLNFSSGQSTRVYEDSFLPKRALDRPIPSGGAVSGILMVIVKGVDAESLHTSSAIADVSFKDVNDKSYSAEEPFSSEQLQIVTGGDIQPSH